VPNERPNLRRGAAKEMAQVMFLRSVVLGSAAIVASGSSLQHVVNDAHIKIHGATLEPISQCPATAIRGFQWHHDGLQKDRRAEATFHFDPLRDGCYLIEERTKLDATQWSHFYLKNCVASANTKVHVHYGEGLQAVGTVDQTPKGFQRQVQNQWTFIGALDFYAGHPGNVTLSNDGTEPGTLTMFDQVRFTWSGKKCDQTHAHPRRVEIQMTVDFKHIANRLTVFGIAFPLKISQMAGIPADLLRLTDLRPDSSNSIIAEILVLPWSSLGRPELSELPELLRSAVSKNAAELCALSTGPLEGCNIELKDLGVARPSVARSECTAVPPYSCPGQPTQQQHADGNGVSNHTVHSQLVGASMEKGHSVEEKELVERDINSTMICPSISDKQIDSSLCYGTENASTPKEEL